MKKIKPITSFIDFRRQLKKLPTLSKEALKKCKKREPLLTKPIGSLGRLEEISSWISSWQGEYPPSISFPQARVFAGNHGIVKQGVSAYPGEVTAQMVKNFEAGGGAINQICQTFGIELQVIPIHLHIPTNDFTKKPAMSHNQCLKAINIGIKSVSPYADILCLGEMGIGNTTSAAALCYSIYGGSADIWTGVGTGLDSQGLNKKIRVVESAIKFHKSYIDDGLEALIRLGGFELSAIVGAIFAARLMRIPVVLDGYITTSAAVALEATEKGALDHCLVSHVSTEPGHRRILETIQKKPLLDFNMRLGEASGAALAVGLLKAAVNCHNGMSTFAEAAVSNKDEQKC